MALMDVIHACQQDIPEEMEKDTHHRGMVRQGQRGSAGGNIGRMGERTEASSPHVLNFTRPNSHSARACSPRAPPSRKPVRKVRYVGLHTLQS